MSQTISVANLPSSSTITGSETTLVVQGGVTRRTTVDNMLRIGDRVAPASHTHAISGVNGLQSILDGKANAGAITSAGLTASQQVLIGRFDFGSGNVQQITLGSGLSLSATGVLSATGGGGGGGGSGTVMSIGVDTGTGLLTSMAGNGPITSSGTISLDLSVIATRSWVNGQGFLTTAPVSSVAGLNGAISVSALKSALSISWTDISDRPTLGTAASAATSDFAPASHTHTISNVTGLQTAIDGKANLSHAHAIADVTGLQAALDGKANTSHSHSAFTGATAGAAGAMGFVPAPAAGQQGSFLRGDGTWVAAVSTGANTWTGTQTFAGQTLDGPQLKAHRFLSANKGTVSSGTVTFTVSDAPHQRLQCGGALTLAFTGWAPAGSFSDMMLELVNGGGVNLSWPVAINWVKADGTTTTSFGSNGVTLTAGATNRDWVYLWSTDGGTTIFGKIVR